MAFRGIIKETIMVSALVSALIYSAFLLPYVAFVNRATIPIPLIMIYSLIVIGYSAWWMNDKRVD